MLKKQIIYFLDFMKSQKIITNFIAVALIASTLTRLTLVIINFKELPDSILVIIYSFIGGLSYDLFIAICLIIPFAIFLLIMPYKWRTSKFFYWTIYPACFLFSFANIYLGVTELFFFNEFSSRFNYVAVDYLIYPHEVFINIWDTYPVLTVIIVTIMVALLATVFLRKKLTQNFIAYPKLLRKRFFILLFHSLLAMLLYTITNTNSSGISDNRILNEISYNGVYTFFSAGLTNELDYNQYYETISDNEANKKLRDLVSENKGYFLDNNSLERFVTSQNQFHRFNIVLVLEESFSSDFIGTLTPDGPNLTPQFDSLSEKSMLFTHVYATGNRTVRGLEASLLSFPPIPGRSIVKRPGSENLFSLPALLKDKGYNTIFLYGGLSYFDNFGHFASTNNFETVVDELDFKKPVFKTIWGVSDEDLFNKSLEIFDTLTLDEKPFFATMITVSNHSPYTYPTGRIPYDPAEQKRENAVRYADYAIGKFIKDAQSHPFYDSTLFIFLADHGARVYGSEEIPLRSYRIPVLFHNTHLIPDGLRINTLGSQMDLAPTILDLLGFQYNSMFFGRSILSTPREEERALMSHNRDVSLLKNDTLVVLNIKNKDELWQFDSTNSIHRIDPSVSSPLVKEAIAYYMTSYNLFKEHRLHPLKNNIVSSSSN